jgi:hydroxypyruvate isomerase
MNEQSAIIRLFYLQQEPTDMEIQWNTLIQRLSQLSYPVNVGAISQPAGGPFTKEI